MVVLFNDNAAEAQTFLRTNGFIMSNPPINNIVSTNSTAPTIRNEWTQPPPPAINGVTNNKNEAACAALICRPNSHPFTNRSLVLEPTVEVKVGRSLARNRATDNNAIFDCKVLSRNHAVIWYREGKFYIKDTGSSNGTFINNQRLSQGNAQSDPFEVSSGDIVQFGVDVTENSSRKETHGCIVATLKLFLPDGRETKAGQSTVVGSGTGNVTTEDLYRLNQYVQEAVQREQLLESKLLNLQKIVDMTRKNSSCNWQAMIDEDRLLSRIDILENKLQCFQKNSTEQKFRDDVVKLIDDKSVYQNSAKEALRKVYEERSEAYQKLSAIERALCSSEDECSLLRDQLYKTQRSLQDVTSQLTICQTKCDEYSEKCAQADTKDLIKDIEMQNLYAQLKQKNAEFDESRSELACLVEEKCELEGRVNLYKYCDVILNTCMENEDDDPGTLAKIAKLLSKNDLKNNEESENSVDIMSQVSEKNVDNLKKVDPVKEKLVNAQKMLESLEFDMPYTPEGSSELETSDGNQNINEVRYTTKIKDMVSHLWIIFFEMKKRVATQKEQNAIDDNLQCSNGDGQLKSRVDELEIQLNSAKLELQTQQLELETRPTYNQFQEKIKISDELQNEILFMKSESENLQIKIGKMETESKTLENELNEMRKKKITHEQVGEEEEVKNQSVNKLLLTSTCNTVDTDVVQSVDEIVLFKEKFNSLSEENIKMKEEMNILKVKYEDSIGTSSRFMMLLCFVVVFISYFCFKFFV